MTFLFKVSPDICMERIKKRGIVLQFFEQKEKLAKIWRGYEEVTRRFENIIVIDGERQIEVIAEEINKIVIKKFPEVSLP